jgi:undecaprenyl diphosphate synthase
VSLDPLRHVAIIMDGNNRWAKHHGKLGISGHKAGVERIRDVLETCCENGVESLTLFAFSSENWRRPPKEVEALMGLFSSYLKKEARQLAKEGVQLNVIGRRDRFSKRLLKTINDAESIASEGRYTLNIAADYGGCWDITQAARTLAEQVQAGELSPESISEELISQHTSTAGQAPLDLLIRTGGEYRISNFLLWQAAYAELYFSPALWPDFGREQLLAAFEEFNQRQRRFGKTSEQLKKEAEGA